MLHPGETKYRVKKSRRRTTYASTITQVFSDGHCRSTCHQQAPPVCELQIPETFFRVEEGSIEQLPAHVVQAVGLPPQRFIYLFPDSDEGKMGPTKSIPTWNHGEWTGIRWSFCLTVLRFWLLCWRCSHTWRPE